VRHVWKGLASTFTDTPRVTFIFCQKRVSSSTKVTSLSDL
jgi:hypothetical protein